MMGWGPFGKRQATTAFDPATLPAILGRLTGESATRFTVGPVAAGATTTAPVRIAAPAAGAPNAEAIASSIVSAPAASWATAGLPAGVAMTASLAAPAAAAAALSAGVIAALVAAMVGAVGLTLVAGAVVVHRLRSANAAQRQNDAYVLSVIPAATAEHASSKTPLSWVPEPEASSTEVEPVAVEAATPAPLAVAAGQPTAAAQRDKGIRNTFYRWTPPNQDA